MIISTSSSIEGHPISEYLGIVSANAISMKGWAAGIDAVCKLLEQNAKKLGADAVIAVSFQWNTSGFYALGTAVKLSADR